MPLNTSRYCTDCILSPSKHCLNRELMFLYMLIENIKDNLKLFNNTHGFEPNILEKPFFVLSGW